MSGRKLRSGVTFITKEMNEKGIPGKANSSCKDRKRSERDKQGRRKVGGRGIRIQKTRWREGETVSKVLWS